MLVGARRSTSPAVLAAAVYEGVAHTLAAIAEVVIPTASSASADLAVCGGGSRSDVWCQVIADVSGRTVRRVSDEHASLRGAAACAHVALGAAPVGAASTLATFSPRRDRVATHRAVAPTFRRLGRVLAGTFAELAQARS